MAKVKTKEVEQLEDEITQEQLIEDEVLEDENEDEVADILTGASLEKKISAIVEEKISLAQTALDNEIEEIEDEEEAKSGFGLFPALLIGAVVLVAGATILLNNRPNEAQAQNEG